MNKQQPEALRLAEMLTADEWPGHVTLVSYAQECVTELLRQHAENETLRAGYAAARLEIESLKAQLHAAKQINAAQFGLLSASIPGSALRASHGQAPAGAGEAVEKGRPMTTTPTSGAADPRATFSEMLVDLPDTEPYTLFKAGFDAALAAGQATAAQAVVPSEWPTNEMIDAGRKAAASQGRLLGSGQSLWHVFRAMLAAAPAQPAAQQGVAYAALPTSSHAGRVYEEGFLIGTCPLYTADKMRAFADATHALRASHGQAPAGAAEEIDKALNVYAQAFAARVNGWTRQNGDDLPGARSALFAAIHAYAQASTRPTTSPQADNKKKDPL